MANTLIPLVLLGFTVWYYYKEIYNDAGDGAIEMTTSVLTAITCLLQIVSGTVLVWAVFCIRSFMKST